MKPVRRATCPTCNYDTNTADNKPRCPKDGTLLRLSSQWYARGTVAGERIFRACGPTKADAEAFIATCLLAKRSGTIIPGKEPDISWHEAVTNCNKWWARANIRPGTRKHYRMQIKILTRYFQDMSLLTISKLDVREMLIDMTGRYAPASIVLAAKALKRIYDLHLENLDMEKVPRPKLAEKAFIIGKMPMPKVDNEKIVSCTEEDLQRVLSAIADGSGKEFDKRRIRLALLMGVSMLLRPANINALEWSEVDFNTGTINIPAGKMKGKRDYTGVMPAQIAEELQAWPKVGRYVFPSPKNPDKPISSMYGAITGWIKKMGLNEDGVSRREKITPYILTRHTGATLLYEDSGENLEMTSKVAHHSNSGITRKRYIRDRVDYARKTVVPLQDAILKRICISNS